MRNPFPECAVGLFLVASTAFATDWTVDIVADENDSACVVGDCSLREAIAGATGGDTVLFALPGSSPWTIRLSSGLSVGIALTITGPGFSQLTITGDSDSNGTGNFRTLVVQAAGDLTLSGVTLRDGLATSSSDRDGGCARVAGKLTVDDLHFENCKAWSGGTSLFNLSRGGEGGAVYVAAGATFTATDSTFVSNVAGQGEIGPDGTTAGPGGRGGAIATAGAVSIARTTFSSNTAGKGGSPNGNGGAGGAIAVLSGGSLLLEDSTLAQNRSGDGNNVAFGTGADGAGGGIDCEADATLNDVTFSGNAVGSTAVGTAAVGGGLVVSGGTTRLRNVSIASNVSNGAGGGVARTGGTIVLRNSIVAGNSSSGTTSEDCTTNLAGSFQSEGHNVLSVSTGCATSLVGTDQVGAAGLGTFGNYGGPTATYSLTSSSPALDGGDPAGCEAWDPSIPGDVAMTTDQRGEPRPVDGDGDLTATCDAGSYEAPEPPKYALTVATGGSGAGSVTSAPSGVDCPGDCTEEFFSGTQVTLTPAADSGSVFTGWSGDCTGTGACTPTMSAAKSVTADFALLRHLSLTFAGDGGGTVTSDPAGIDCTGACGAEFADGASVTLQAAPYGDSLFVAWSGDCGGATCELTMGADRSATATFLLRLIFANGFENAFTGWSGVVN